MIWVIALVVVMVVFAAVRMATFEGEAPTRQRSSSPATATRARPRDQDAPPSTLATASLIFSLLADAETGVQSVKSRSTPGLRYQVDTTRVTCTCPDFVGRRMTFATNDFRRLCKHLAGAMTPIIDWEHSSEWGPVLIQGTRAKLHFVTGTLSSGAAVLIGYSPDDPWIDVYSRKRKKGDHGGVYTGEYDCFGFNVDRNGWSFGDGPPGAREIRSMLKELLGSPAAHT
jgi:hypothetical protein